MHWLTYYFAGVVYASFGARYRALYRAQASEMADTLYDWADYGAWYDALVSDTP